MMPFSKDYIYLPSIERKILPSLKVHQSVQHKHRMKLSKVEEDNRHIVELYQIRLVRIFYLNEFDTIQLNLFLNLYNNTIVIISL